MCAGYDQTMALPPRGILLAGGIVVTLLATACAVLCCLAGADRQDASTRKRRWLVLAWLLSLLFLCWKHGFVRSDQHHNYLFFGFMAVFALLLRALPLANGRVRSFPYGLAGLASILAFTSLQISLQPESLHLSRCFSQVGPNIKSLFHPVTYREQMNQALGQARRAMELPGVRTAVGPASVDVFGNYQTFAILNGLNYRPRPVFQSYSAYNAPLALLNEDFYLSGKAPQYVLATLEPIDQRFPPLEDSLLFRDLLINYDLRGIEGGFLLLHVRAHENPRLTLLSEATVRPGQQIALNSFGETNLWLQINVEPAPIGRLRQLLYQSPKPRLRFWSAATAKSPQEFCAPASMLAAGFVASPLLVNDEDLLALYAGKPVARPSAYSVELGSSAFAWKSEIHFRIYKIENALGSRTLNQADRTDAAL